MKKQGESVGVKAKVNHELPQMNADIVGMFSEDQMHLDLFAARCHDTGDQPTSKYCVC